MKVLDTAREFRLEDEKVWVAGDWHGNVPWLQILLPALKRNDPSIRTLLHVGDFWMNLESVDYWASRAALDRLLVIPGNHEPWGEYRSVLGDNPGCAVQVSRTVWLLPRPWRFWIGERSILALGGAASIDRLERSENVDWWPDERIRGEEVASAIMSGAADVMLTHETPDSTPVPQIQEILDSDSGAPEAVKRELFESRQHIDRAWDGCFPALLLHGHMHVFGEGVASDGRKVVSLDRDGAVRGNVASLRLRDLSLDYPRIVSRRG